MRAPALGYAAIVFFEDFDFFSGAIWTRVEVALNWRVAAPNPNGIAHCSKARLSPAIAARAILVVLTGRSVPCPGRFATRSTQAKSISDSFRPADWRSTGIPKEWMGVRSRVASV